MGQALSLMSIYLSKSNSSAEAHGFKLSVPVLDVQDPSVETGQINDIEFIADLTDARIKKLKAVQKRNKNNLGWGAMGSVYKCEFNGEEIAIKFYFNNKVATEELGHIRELVTKTPHPNIIDIKGILNDINHYALLMELCPSSLNKEIDKRDYKPEFDQIHSWATQIAQGMAHLHALGIVHFDLKPHNVLIAKDGTLKVADFGHSREMRQSVSALSHARGTVPYEAPEMFHMETRISSTVDVYSYGVTLWALCMGKHPFSTLMAEQIILNVGQGTLKIDSNEISDDLQLFSDMIKRCTAWKPHDRPTFERLLDDLDGIDYVELSD